MVVATHLYGAIDAGFVVNPAAVENQISGQLVQAASRILKEEVTFSKFQGCLFQGFKSSLAAFCL